MGPHLSQEEESSKRACGRRLLIGSDVAGVLEHWGGQVGGDGFELMILLALLPKAGITGMRSHTRHFFKIYNRQRTQEILLDS